MMKVLIVEDDVSLREYLLRAIELKGLEVRAVENGRVALDIYDSFKPDLVLTDIQMPELDGLSLLKAIRERHMDVIVVVTTGFGSEQYAAEALRLRANNYLNKPVSHADLTQLLDKYRSLIESRTARQEILGMIVKREFTIRLDNRIAFIPRISDYLAVQAAPPLGEDERLSVHLGLYELILNGIEHGNLGITYEEKTAAIEANGLESLRAERLSDPVCAGRRVTVDFRSDQASCEWTISDEGEGFDWRGLAETLERDGVCRPHGRGILITRAQFDEMAYIGAGNVVRVRKVAGRSER